MIYIIEECSLECLAFKLERNPIQKAFNGNGMPRAKPDQNRWWKICEILRSDPLTEFPSELNHFYPGKNDFVYRGNRLFKRTVHHVKILCNE